jgi:hypothetical protein
MHGKWVLDDGGLDWTLDGNLDIACLLCISSQLSTAPNGNFSSPTLFRALLFTRLESSSDTSSIQASVC